MGYRLWGRKAVVHAEEAIAKTVAYFKEIDMPTCHSELGVGVLDDETLRTLALDATMGGTIELSHICKLNVEDVYRIFCMANH